MMHSQVSPPNRLPQRTACNCPPKPGCAAAICGSISSIPNSIDPPKAATMWPARMSISVAEMRLAEPVGPAVAERSGRGLLVDIDRLALGCPDIPLVLHGASQGGHSVGLIGAHLPTRGKRKQRDYQGQSRHGYSLHAGNVALAAVVSSGAIVSMNVVTGA